MAEQEAEEEKAGEQWVDAAGGAGAAGAAVQDWTEEGQEWAAAEGSW